MCVLFLFNSCRKDPPDEVFEIDPVTCFENITGSCNYLSEDETMLFLSRHSCSGYAVMKKFLEDCPDETYINNYILTPTQYLNFFYSDPDLNFDTITATNVLVHESMHHVSYSEADGPLDLFVMLNCDESWQVEMIPTFPCEELSDVIAEDHRTQRYDTYIEAGPTHVTQTRGIYGLLNEFCAYYQSANAVLEVGQSKGVLTDPIASTVHSINTVIPYYELKYWILTYLIYAEDNHPLDFQTAMENDALKQSFIALDTEFESVITNMTFYSDPLDGSGVEELQNVINTLETTPYVNMMAELMQ